MARGKDDDAITIAFRLPRRMHERLKAAAGEESNVSEEIRRRLELTLKIADEAAEEVVDGIAYVSGMLTIEGRWWINPFLHQVMVEAANQLLLPSKPKEPPSHPRSHRLFDEGITPESAARMLVATHINRPGGVGW
jgi:hypothetical protein